MDIGHRNELVELVPFPHDVNEFENDDRISYSTSDGKYLLVDENATEWEFNVGLSKWMETIDDADIEQHLSGYVDPSVTSVDESAGANGNAQGKGKRKKESNGSDNETQKKPKKAALPNRAIYVTGIPLNAEAEEVEYVFSKYGGVIAESDNGEKRVKLYKDEQGHFKGDALIVFFRHESVAQAIKLLDGEQFRPGEKGSSALKVSEAEQSYKKQKDPQTQGPSSRKHMQNIQKMNQKLAEWDDDEPATIPTRITKWRKTVVLKHMFTLTELEEDPAAILEIKEEVREEAERHGEVTKVELYDKEEDGVMFVRFTDPADADKYAQVVNGRWFDKRRVEAYVAEGKLKFQKSGTGAPMDSDEEEEEVKRLERFGDWLEGKQLPKSAMATAPMP